MAKNELVKGIAFILLGICINQFIFTPISQVQEALQGYFASRLWGMRVDIITIVIVGILTIAWFWYSCRKAKKDVLKPEIETILKVISEKMGISQEDLQKAQQEANMAKSKPQPPLTKKRFERLLRKSAQPVNEWESEQSETETSESHPSDGYSGKRKSRDKTVGKGD